MSETYDWYEEVEAGSTLTQGDLILDCPLLTWDETKLMASLEDLGEEALSPALKAIRSDVVVMTQACDLRNSKVRNVVLCQTIPISAFRPAWENMMRAKPGENKPTDKAFRRYCEDIAGGYVWNQTFLNSKKTGLVTTELRLVDFKDIFTVPVKFVQTLVHSRNAPRLRLRTPYREHLAQSFARYFMRVGLPTQVDTDWVATGKTE